MGLQAFLRPAEHEPGKAGAVATTTLAVLLAAAGLAGYFTRAPRVDLIGIQLHLVEPLSTGSVRALWWSIAALTGVGAALLLGTTAALWTVWTARAISALRFVRTIAGVAVLAAGAATIVLLAAEPDWWPRELAAAAAVITWSAMVVTGPVAAYGILVTWYRCAFTPAQRIGRTDGQACAPLNEDDPPSPDVLRFAAAPAEAPAPQDRDRDRDRDREARDAQRWRRGYQVPEVEPHAVGFCLSGGGIRAASIAMGVLQSMRARLLGARYLVSVSGGGFTSGALQQLLTDTDAPADAVRDPETAFGPGTVEEDFVRRHVSYLAGTPAEMFTALGVLARGLLLSLAALFAPAVVLGVFLGRYYEIVPLAALPAGPVFATPRMAALLALGALALSALLTSLAGRALRRRGTVAGILRRLSARLAVLMGLVAVLTVVLPLLVRLVRLMLAQTSVGVQVAAPAGTVVLAYLAALGSILWRNRKKLEAAAKSTKDGIVAAIPNSLLQLLLVMLTTTVLALAWLLLLVAMVGTGKADAVVWTSVGLGVVLGLFDQTSLSLHPFYRERVAGTFALRTVRRRGHEIVVPYPSTGTSTLSTYGKRPRSFPEVIFAAAANLTGEGRTPPGLNCVSYTLSADWVGGPDVGWVRTGKLEGLVRNRLRRDLTVQGAVAVSGAAFASAMGRGARWFQVLFAVSGARLGAWLPNPHFLLTAKRNGWAYPGLPRARRLPYLVREVLGLHSYSDRLLHVTDGGHYDNLGLVELLRRRCAEIYCVDAGVNAPPGATSLSDALTLARQELGVEVEFDKPWQIEPGTAKPLNPGHPMSVLDGRLAECPVLTGTIHYPAESGQKTTGKLVVGKAVLWPRLPYSVLAYAAHQPEFPHESTGDQFFDDGRFTAYTELGRRLGTVMEHTAESPATADSTDSTEPPGSPGEAAEPARPVTTGPEPERLGPAAAS